jgi:hypothetical protein
VNELHLRAAHALLQCGRFDAAAAGARTGAGAHFAAKAMHGHGDDGRHAGAGASLAQARLGCAAGGAAERGTGVAGRALAVSLRGGPSFAAYWRRVSLSPIASQLPWAGRPADSLLRHAGARKSLERIARRRQATR